MLEVCNFWGKTLGHFESLGICMKNTGLSFDDICKSIETGKPVQGMIVSFSDSYLRKCAVNSLIKYHGSYDRCQIARMTGISERRINFIINKSLKKMKGRLSCVSLTF